MTPVIGRELTLRWEGPKAQLRRSTLIDRQTGEKVRVKPDGSYTFIMSEERYSFRWKLKNPKK